MARRTLATRAEAVTALGLRSPRHLDKLIERGAPGPAPGKKGTARYDVEALRAWVEDRRARVKPMDVLLAERAKQAKLDTQMKRLRLREANQELVPASRAVDVQRAIAGAVRAQVLAVPRRAVIAGLPQEFEPLIRRLLHEALSELAEIQTLARLAATEPAAEDVA